MANGKRTGVLLAGRNGGAMEVHSHEAHQGDDGFKSDVNLRNAATKSGPDREAAWTALVHRHGPALKRAIEGVLVRYGRNPDPSAVEDLVESTWLRVTKSGCKKLREWDPQGGASLGTHLVRIALGEALTWCRFRASRREIMMDSQELHRLADQPDSHLTPEQIVWLKEAEGMVRTWEAGLGELERETLRLSREGHDQVEIAQALKRSQQLVSKTLTGLKAMAQRLVEDLVS